MHSVCISSKRINYRRFGSHFGYISRWFKNSKMHGNFWKRRRRNNVTVPCFESLNLRIPWIELVWDNLRGSRFAYLQKKEGWTIDILESIWETVWETVDRLQSLNLPTSWKGDSRTITIWFSFFYRAWESLWGTRSAYFPRTVDWLQGLSFPNPWTERIEPLEIFKEVGRVSDLSTSSKSNRKIPTPHAVTAPTQPLGIF